MNQTITLNVLPVLGIPERVEVYYRPAAPSEKRPSNRHYLEHIDEEAFWLTFSGRKGAAKAITLADHPWMAVRLVREALFDTAAAYGLKQLFRHQKPFSEYLLNIVFEEYSEGRRVMTIRPIRSEALESVGISFLESFWKGPGMPYSRRVQFLAGSLDTSGRPNSQYHVQSWSRLNDFLADARRGKVLRKLTHKATGLEFELADAFATISGSLLHARRYQFGCAGDGARRTGESQLLGGS